MANRYLDIKEFKTRFTKKRYLGSVIYPKIKPTDDDMYIISQESDRLDLLAYKYYGDQSLWWIIAVANNLNDGTLFIENGKQLRIPVNVGQIINDLRKLNK